MDNELASIARTAIGQEYGLTPEQSRRLRGETAGELRADAKAMRRELKLPDLEERERDELGRFRRGDQPRDVNQLIRAAAGR